MRDTVLRFRVSDIEKHKLVALAEQAGKASLAETLRYFIDKSYDDIIIKRREAVR
jgi:hypothetical protein